MEAVLDGGGVTGALVRSIDWSKTPLGPISSWPKSLISAVGLVLHSRHPMFLWWGPELVQFYNDAYLPSFGRGKHPAAMGQCGRDCWQEIWTIIAPQIDDVMRHGKASWNEDALVPIHRNGRLEEVYWTYGYSPVFDDAGQVGGTLVVCTETTSRMLASRRSEFVRQLGSALAACGDFGEILAVTRSRAAEAKLDIPFLLTYRAESRYADWQLTGSANLSEPSFEAIDPVLREQLALPLDSPRRQRVLPAPVTVPGSVWPEPTTEAVLISFETPELGALVCGVSPRLPFDLPYQEFLSEIAQQLDLAATRLEAFRVRAAVESERRNLLLQAPVATALLTGPEHVFELANPLYKEIVGGRDLVGKAYLDAFPEIASTPLAAVLDRVYRSGEPFVAHEYLIPLDRKGDGTLQDCYFKFNLEPIRDARGAVYGMMAVVVDITEQVNARMLSEKATLERERLLTQLEAANSAKDEFLATISHELRTPLTAILGWARLLGDTHEPSRIKKGLSVIERNARAQAQLIEDILDVSRIISGKVRMSMQPVDPGAVVRAAVETVRPAAAAKRIQMRVDIPADLESLVGDEDRLQQVVWNLLSNAVKFTPEGGEVDVRAAQEGRRVRIEVCDTGKGISRAFLPHVFDRFRQDDTSTTKQHAGLGLGLAIVRHLVELHGGTVCAHSEGEGRGATFTLQLPSVALARSGRGPKSGIANAAHAGTTDPRRFDELRVLVVDDQEDTRDLVATLLEDAGAKVTQAASVAAALNVLAKEDIAVVVSDIGMPNDDGYTLIRRLRSNEEVFGARRVPALALTAYARPDDRHRALAAGFQEHVAKPVDPASLIEVVAKLARR